MTQERRYKLYAMNNKEYILDEADLQKLEQNSDKMLVRLKQCIVHPSSIIVIEPFFVKYDRTLIPATTEHGPMMGDPKPPRELQDLFNDTVLKLTGKN
jgi:hypothetical protein